jgi:protein-arginine kinase
MVDIVKNNLNQIEDWIMRSYGLLKAMETETAASASLHLGIT